MALIKYAALVLLGLYYRLRSLSSLLDLVEYWAS
jgi:hypothetical protein